MNALITFGCSWTQGKASWYPEEGMSKEEFIARGKERHDPNQPYSFRSILAKRHGYENVNFSRGGSSNHLQFRLAEEYFNTDDYKKYDDVIVLWGITSTSRMELWCNEIGRHITCFYSDSNIGSRHKQHRVGKIIREDYYDHDVEVDKIGTKIKHWDKFFELLGIRNYWFDTFNHHDYKELSPNMIMKDNHRRDLLSTLCKNERWSFALDSYHQSAWTADSDRIKFLVAKNLANPYSLHPNVTGHIKIADILDKYVKFCYYK